jgi:hypothetical protein
MDLAKQSLTVCGHGNDARHGDARHEPDLLADMRETNRPDRLPDFLHMPATAAEERALTDTGPSNC